MDWTYGGGAYYSGELLSTLFLIGILGMGSYIFLAKYGKNLSTHWKAITPCL